MVVCDCDADGLESDAVSDRDDVSVTVGVLRRVSEEERIAVLECDPEFVLERLRDFDRVTVGVDETLELSDTVISVGVLTSHSTPTIVRLSSAAVTSHLPVLTSFTTWVALQLQLSSNVSFQFV